MGQNDGEHTAIKTDADEQQQQGQACNHLGHHQRRIDHAREQTPPHKAPCADQNGRGHRAQNRCQNRRKERHADCDPSGIKEVFVLKKLSVPFGGKARPDRDQLRCVEAVDDQNDHRQIEERKAQCQGRGVEP